MSLAISEAFSLRIAELSTFPQALRREETGSGSAHQGLNLEHRTARTRVLVQAIVDRDRTGSLLRPSEHPTRPDTCGSPGAAVTSPSTSFGGRLRISLRCPSRGSVRRRTTRTPAPGDPLNRVDRSGDDHGEARCDGGASFDLLPGRHDDPRPPLVGPARAGARRHRGGKDDRPCQLDQEQSGGRVVVVVGDRTQDDSVPRWNGVEGGVCRVDGCYVANEQLGGVEQGYS